MFPATGMPWEAIAETLRMVKKNDFDWRRGRVPAFVHYYNDTVYEVAKNAYMMFMAENVLGAGKIFPSLQILLDDIEQMMRDLFQAPREARATFTSGGTESVLLAAKAARDRARARRNVSTPNIVAGLAAHPALNKAGELFGIEIRQVGLSPDLRTDLNALEDHIDDSTVMVLVSAPCFPYGLIDDVLGAAALTAPRDIWLHVDACWGGFISPFARELGYALPVHDFAIDGVTSLSADIHKYGYGAKGASVLLFRDRELQECAVFRHEWVRGIYETPTLAGTRPGGAVAAAWAVMKFLGREGYRAAVKEAMGATDALRTAIAAMPELRVLPDALEANLFLFVSQDPRVQIDAVADALRTNGWYPGRIKQPHGIHMAIAPAHAPVICEYLTDLAAAVATVKRERRQGRFDERSY